MPGAGGKYGDEVGLNLQCSFLFRKDALKLGFQNPCGMVLGNQGICCTDHGKSVGGGEGGVCFSAAETGFIHLSMQPHRQADRNGDRSTESEKVLLLSYGLRYV